MISGKGFWIWKILDCEGGEPGQIAAAANHAGLSHVLLKIADGTVPVNVTKGEIVVDLSGVVQALHAAGIQAWGWHYVYGNYPQQEAEEGVTRTVELGLDGYVIDAEREFKQAGWAAKAEIYAQAVRRGLAPKGIPIALSSFRYPSLHPEFPWQSFLEQVDYNFPQVYWEQSHNAGDQLRRCVREFSTLAPVRPVMPMGLTYKVGGWAPTAEDLKAFLDVATELNKLAVSFFSWDECRRDLPGLWDVVSAEVRWPGPSFEPPAEVEPEPAGEGQGVRAGEPIRGRVMVAGLNVRSSPGTGYPDIGDLRQGDQVEILEVDGSDAWARIGEGKWCAIRTGGKQYLQIE